MLIILEGVDGAGKSTLASALQHAIRRGMTEVIHFSQPKQEAIIEYEHALDRYRAGSGTHIICDRFHWGAMIYGPLYRGRPDLTPAEFWHVEQFLKSRGALMVLVTANLSVIQQRLIQRGEDYLQPSDVKRVHGQFDAMIDETTLPFSIINTAQQPRVIDLLKLAEQRETATLALADYPSYVGPLEPDLLLVGEQPNDRADQVVMEGAFIPFSFGSGRYLIENVVLHADKPAGIGLVNAYHHGGVPIDVMSLWKLLGEPRVVTLGKMADHHLSIMGVPHTTAPHPQWWRRFRHHDQQEYRDMILTGEPR